LSPQRKIRVLLVDDSLFMRVAIKRLVESDDRFEVVGEAKDGEGGVQLVLDLSPDVVTMDVNMPNMNGVAAVTEIMRVRPTPVLMLSAHTQDGARVTLEALAAGAVDFLAKPSGEVSVDLQAIAAPLHAKLAQAAQANTRAFVSISSPSPAPTRRPSRPARPATPSRPPMTTDRYFPIVVIGVSAGGPSALARVLPRLPGRSDLSIIVVQHMPEHFTGALAERLDGMSAIRVVEARTEDRLRTGVAYVARGDKHLEVQSNGRLALTDGPTVHGCRPSVDMTMRSVAKAFGKRVVGVILTGMGRDGADGMAEIQRAGGRTIAQDEATSVIYGMPRVAAEQGVVDEVVPLDEIATRLLDREQR